MIQKTTDVKTYMDDFADHAKQLGLWVMGHDYGDSMEDLNLPTMTHEYSLRVARYYEDERSINSVVYGPYVTTPVFSCHALDGNEDKIIMEWFVGQQNRVLSMTLAGFKQWTQKDISIIVDTIVFASYEVKQILTRLTNTQNAAYTTIDHILNRCNKKSLD